MEERKCSCVCCWWECELVQPLWKTVWRFCKKLKTELPYDSTTPLLGIYPEKTKTLIQKDTCTHMFITALDKDLLSHKKEWINAIYSNMDGPKDYHTKWSKSERNTIWCYSYTLNSLSHVRLFATPWTVAYQASPSMGFFRQEYWSGLPFPSPRDLPDPGIEPRSPTL